MEAVITQRMSTITEASDVASQRSLSPPPKPFPLEALLVEEDNSDTATVHYDYDDMSDVDVVGIQRACADTLSTLLPQADSVQPDEQHLAAALTDLLEASYDLETFHPSCSISSPHTPPEDGEAASPYLSLIRVLTSVETAASNRSPNPLALADAPATASAAVAAVREELAWARVESLSHAVLQLVRERDLSSLPPKYRRTERNSSEGSESFKSLPPYNDHHNDSEILESSPYSVVMEKDKPITGAGDLKARLEEEAALQEAERRAVRHSKMGTILTDMDTVTHAIERLHSIAPQLQDQRVPLRPVSLRPVPKPAMSELDFIVDRINRTSGTTRLDDQRIDPRRLSRRKELLTTLEDTARTLEAGRPQSPQANLARAKDLRERSKAIEDLLHKAPLADRASERSVPSAGSIRSVSSQPSSCHETSASCGHSSAKKHNHRKMALYDNGPLRPQSRPVSPSPVVVKDFPRSLSPSSMDFMFKELPLPPTHEPRSRSRASSRGSTPPRPHSPSSIGDPEATIRPHRARSPPRGCIDISFSSRSSSLARMPLREESMSIASSGLSPALSPTFSDMSVSSWVSGPQVQHEGGRLSMESALSKTSSASRSTSTSTKPKGFKPTPLTIPPRTHKVAHRREELFDLLSMAVSTGRMSNQEVELPPLMSAPALKADWGGLTSTDDDTPPVTPGLVESVADGEWVIRLQDREYGSTTPRTSVTPRKPGFPKHDTLKTINRRNSFSSIISTATAAHGIPQPPVSASATGSFRKIVSVFHRQSNLNRKVTRASKSPSPVKMSKSPSKSGTPPLRTSGVIDGSAITYVTEHQENLRVIQVLLSGVDTTFLKAGDLQLEVTTPKIAVLTSKSDPMLRVPVHLPSPAPLGQLVTVQPADDHLEAKLAALPSNLQGSAVLHSTVAHALSAPDLRSLAPHSLCCTSCDRLVARLPLHVEFKDLPSEYWAEMIEAWMCHADPAFTSQLAKHTEDGFWPKGDTVLVGGSYLLLTGSHICDVHLSLSKSNERDQWRIITCQCGEVLGKLRPEDGRPGAGTVRFSKWAIALLRGRGAGEIEPVRFPVSTFVVSDMLELSQAHASYRFLICDEQSGDRRLAIWVFNPSMGVAYGKAQDRHASSSPTKEGGLLPPRKTLRAAKIMYKVIEPYSPTAEYENLPGFGPRGQVEHLRYPRDVCETVIETLRESSSLLPPARRSMGSFNAGFLERV